MKIRKKLNKLLIAFLSLFLIFTAIPAYADETVNQPDHGSITIHKYTKGDTAGSPASGIEDPSQVPDGAKALPNISFKITKLHDIEGKSVKSLRSAADVDEKMMSATESYTIKTADGTDGTTIGVAKQDSLSLGTYYVEELDNAAVTEKCAPFIVVLPMSNPDNQTLNYNVHVYPKNTTEGSPEIHKSVTSTGNMHDTAHIGKDVTWIVEPTIPKGIASGKQYTVTDKINDNLKYTGNLDISFKVNNETVKLAKDTDYKVTEPTADKGGTLTINFTDKGMKELSKGTAGERIQITFTTVIVSGAPLGTDIPNQAKLIYTNAVDQSFTPESERPDIHTGGVALLKVDSSNTKKLLQGAKFKIYSSLEDAKAKKNAVVKADGKDYEVTTNDKGYAEFVGLAYGEKGQNAATGSSKYYIVETQAPSYDDNGTTRYYNLLKDPMEVTVNATSHLETNKVTIENSRFTLPITGGRGTVIFTMIGAVLMIGGAFMAFSNKKKTSVE